MASNAVRVPINAEGDQAEAVQAFGKALHAIKQARMLGPEGQEIPIPEPLYRVLEQVVPLLAADMAVSIVPVGHNAGSSGLAQCVQPASHQARCGA